MNVLITGGASGLGEALTTLLARNSANQIWFTYCSSAEKARAIEAQFANARGIHCDFREKGDLEGLLSKMDDMSLGGLVNNALPVRISKKHFHKIEAEVFSNGFHHTLLPTVLITQKAISLFRKAKAGRIVTILTAALISKPPAGYAEYAAVKAYLHSLAKSWASENAPFGITSNCVSPGFMKTQLTSDTDERLVDDMMTRHPLKRLLEPAEVAAAVEFYLMASPQINGTNLAINAAADIA